MANSTDPDQLASEISWLLQKPADLDLHCLQRQDIFGFTRTRVNDTSTISALSKYRAMFYGFLINI